MRTIENYVLPEGRALGLKVVYSDGRPEHWNLPEEFKGWNLEPGGETEAPDWNPKAVFGGGLHVWAWAQGDLELSSIWQRPDVVWLVVEYDSAKAVDPPLSGSVKVPKCRTIAVSSNRKEVIAFIQEHTPEEKRGPVFFEEKIVEEGSVEVGDKGTAESRGFGGSAEAGRLGTAIAGDGGTATAGRRGTAIAGVGGKAVAGQKGTAFTGEGGVSVVGSGGFAGTRDKGIAIAGDYGVAIAGVDGTASVGFGGRAKAGERGRIIITYRETYALFSARILFVGEDGIKPDVCYELNAAGHPIEAFQQSSLEREE